MKRVTLTKRNGKVVLRTPLGTLKPKNVNKIYPDGEILNTMFNKIILTVDGLMSPLFKFEGQKYDNGEQSLFYRHGPYYIDITIYGAEDDQKIII